MCQGALFLATLSDSLHRSGVLSLDSYARRSEYADLVIVETPPKILSEFCCIEILLLLL